MIKAYYTAASGANSNKDYLDVISNNMANIQTAGFKKSKPEFSDLIYTNIRQAEGVNTLLKSGTGSKVKKTDTVFTQGIPFETGVPTDFAILGDGFFAVQFEEEIFFTRAGNFEIVNADEENYLMYLGGYVLDNDEEPIIIENKESIENLDVGIYVFNNNFDLQPTGNNLYKIHNEDGEYIRGNESDEIKTKVLKGYLESSNVEVSEEMIKLIQLQRAFQLNSTVLHTADEIEQTINSLRG